MFAGVVDVRVNGKEDHCSIQGDKVTASGQSGEEVRDKRLKC
jgi:hypothetical protein